MAWFDPKATRESLDALTGDHPVVLQTLGGHGAIVNTAALTSLGLGTTPPDLPGGWFERTGKSSTTNGRLLESACFDFDVRLQKRVDPATVHRDFQDLVARKLRLGWTSLQTMATVRVTEMVPLAVADAAPLRIRVMRIPVNTADTEEIRGPVPAIPPPGSSVTVSGLKWSSTGHHSRKRPPSAEPSPTGRSRGRFPGSVRLMLQQGETLHQPLLFHAVGEVAIDELFTAMESMPGDRLADSPRSGSNTATNSGPRCSPAPSGWESSWSRTPSTSRCHRARPGPPLPEPGRAGRRNPFGRWWKPASHSPWARTGRQPALNILLAATNPNNPDEALTREQAVVAFTRGAAYAEFAEKEKGTLAPGMLADFVVLSKDIFTAPAADVPTIRPVLTVIGGKVAFDALAPPNAGTR